MVPKQPFTQNHVQWFIELLGHANVSQNLNDLESVSRDYTEDLSFLPDLLLIPSNTEQLSNILKYCNEHKISVYTRGAGTGLSGACLPVHGGVVISMKKFNKILHIDKENFQVTVESGVVNAELKEILKPFGLTYPPDPASMGSSTIGGNIAHGAGGPKAVKYGTTRDYVLNLEVVLPTGDVIWTGANTLKNSTGFSLTHLMIGSEGLLGIVTKAVLKLIPLKTQELLMLASFDNASKAASCVNSILINGFEPAGIELMEVSGVEIAMEILKIPFPKPANTAFYLLIILDGNNMDELNLTAENLYPFLEEEGAIEVYLPNNSEMSADWWKIRRSLGELVKQQSVYKEEDTVVPRSKLPELLSGVKGIGKKYGFRSVCYGHAGDGNLHVNILKDQMTEDQWKNEVPMGIVEIFQLCKSLGGTISGEHGIGLVQAPYLKIVLSDVHLNIMKGIKQSFDPNGILNPGKWL
jgi:glycolate oxidase